jgi:type IV pilus assembly protein PilV
MYIMRSGLLQREGQRGFTMLEVLVTIVITAFGLLGLAGLQTKMIKAEMEAYQRIHALVLLQDMADRINSNRLAVMAGHYDKIKTTATKGSEQCKTDEGPEDEDALAAISRQDTCEWESQLMGSGVSDGSNNIGAMISAMGCVESINANPKTLRISVAWQGLTASAVPEQALSCGSGLYGDETLRRVVSQIVVLANLAGG